MHLWTRASALALAASFASGAPAPGLAQTPPPAAAQAAASAGSAAVATWAEMSGYKRYHANCSTCHGPDGLGGTFAPNLTNSLKALTHDQFYETVVNGKHDGNLAMPAFGTNPNIMCYIEDIYTYLKDRSDDKIARGRPDNVQPKPAEATAAENACMGG